MNTKRLLPALIAALSFGAAQAAPIIISNPWNFDGGGTTWSVTGTTDLVVNPNVNGDTINDIFRWAGAGTAWANRAATDDTSGLNIGGNLGANRRFRSEVSATPAGPTPDGSGNFLSFSVENTGTTEYTIDQFSFGVGRNVQTAAWLYTSIVIGATETALTADATSASSSVGAGGWDDPLVQFGPGTGANAWAKPVYSDIGLTLAGGQTAEFRIYLASGNTTTFFHLNDVQVSVIPEPGTLVLVGIALGSVFFFRRRR